MGNRPIQTAVWLATFAVLGSTASVADHHHDPAALAVIERLGSYKTSLDSFRIEAESYSDARLAEGFMAENNGAIEVLAKRPGSLFITHSDGDETKQLFFEDGSLTVFSERHRYYAKTEVPPAIEDAVEFAVEEMSIDAPLLDFMYRNATENLLAGASRIMHLGKATIRGVECDYVALRLPETDVQLWVEADDTPLPRKMVMTSKWEGGSPRFTVFMEWTPNPNIPARRFRFQPPDNATEIEFHPGN